MQTTSIQKVRMPSMPEALDLLTETPAKAAIT
jgi:hypothetical protein